MKTIIFSILFFLSTGLQAQVIISLEQAANYKSSPDGIPEGVTYVKDINNRLPTFVGIWKGVTDGKSVELHLNKFLHLPQSADGFKLDQMSGRLLIKDVTSNQILYNTLNIANDEQTSFEGYYFINTSYVATFRNINENYCRDLGEVYLEVLNSDPNKMKLVFFRSQEIIVTGGGCPNFSTYVPILPKSIMLMRQ